MVFSESMQAVEREDARPSLREQQELTEVTALVHRITARHAQLSAAKSADLHATPVGSLSSLTGETQLGQLVERAARCGLGVPGADLLRIALAAERDVFCFRALGQLAPDPVRPGIGVEALAIVAAYLGHGTDAVLSALSPEGVLRRLGLVEMVRAEGPLLAQRFAVAPRLVAWLATGKLAALYPMQLQLPPPIEQLTVAAGVRERLVRHFGAGVGPVGLWLAGPRGVGKRSLLAALAAASGRRLISIPYQRALDKSGESGAELVAMLWREALLFDAIVCIQDAESNGQLQVFYELLRRAEVPTVFTSVTAPPLGEFDVAPPLVEMPEPGIAARAALWRSELPGCERIDEIAGQFRLSPGRLVRVAAAARAAGREAEHPPTVQNVVQAISAEVSQKIALLGTKIEDQQGWDDLVLPPDTLDAMREIVSRARWRFKVLTQWGFQRKLAKGVGLSALFSGPPGTGKTMVAGIIARELGLELYQIDLSRMVSKWVGETEKNLSEVFDAADWGNVLLLFDEADSLFAKRTEVKSANDRFSNLETNYLLQRIERFEGISILTTNLEGSIDPAFRRRLTFRVHFPMPDVGERELLWRRMLPKEAEVEGDLQFRKMAEKYELSGGNIRNAMLRAAFLAAGERRAIAMKHIERAVVLEYQDAGMISVGGRLHS